MRRRAAGSLFSARARAQGSASSPREHCLGQLRDSNLLKLVNGSDLVLLFTPTLPYLLMRYLTSKQLQASLNSEGCASWRERFSEAAKERLQALWSRRIFFSTTSNSLRHKRSTPTLASTVTTYNKVDIRIEYQINEQDMWVSFCFPYNTGSQPSRHDNPLLTVKGLSYLILEHKP